MCLVVTSDDKDLSLDTNSYEREPVYHLLNTQNLDICQHQNHINFLGTYSYIEPDHPDMSTKMFL